MVGSTSKLKSRFWGCTPVWSTELISSFPYMTGNRTVIRDCSLDWRNKSCTRIIVRAHPRKHFCRLHVIHYFIFCSQHKCIVNCFYIIILIHNKKALLCYNLCRSFLSYQFLSSFCPISDLYTELPAFMPIYFFHIPMCRKCKWLGTRRLSLVLIQW